MSPTEDLAPHPVVSREQWLAARIALLEEEKAFTQQRDALSRQRRALPWVRVDERYVFDGPNGTETLAELFQGRSQLLVYHFMFDPEWDEGCKHCSFWADHFDGAQVHLEHRDVTLVVISRAPLAKLSAFQRRMGWRFKWLSSHGNAFNYDFQVSFTPEQLADGSACYNFTDRDPGFREREGLSAFRRGADGAVYHTYSCYARGIDMINGTYQLLDLTSKGRDEDELPGPQAWVRHHDRYEA